MGFDEQVRRPGGVSGRPLRVLVVRVGAMGDVLHGLPAVAALRERLPACWIGWAVEPRWRALLAGEGVMVRGTGMPLVDRVHAVPSQTWKRRPFSRATVREIAALRRELRTEKYDVCVDLQGSVRSAVIGWMAGAGRFVGLDRPREGVARVLYGERVAVKAEHVIGHGCELVGAAAGLELEPGRVRLPVEAPAEAWAEGVVKTVGGPGFVLIAAAAGWGAKEWRMQRYEAVAEALERRGYRVLWNAAGGSRLGEGVQPASGAGTVVRCGVGKLVALTRRAGLVIGGDTGPVHLAAGLGRPVVALFGPTDPRRNGPAFVGAWARVLRHETSVVDHRRHRDTEAGLGRITVEEVVAAALASLREDVVDA